MENIDDEKRKFIESKKVNSNALENAKRNKSIIMIIMLVIALLRLCYAGITAMQGKLWEPIVAIVVLGIQCVFLAIISVNSKLGTENYIVNEFINDWNKKYNKIDFSFNENKNDIMNDLSILLKYDTMLGCNTVIDPYFNKVNEYRRLDKYRINEKDVLLGHALTIIRHSSAKHGMPYETFSIVRETKLKGRLHIDTLFKYGGNDNVCYSKDVVDKRNYVKIYDEKYFKNIDYALSESFYKSKFKKESNSELIDLDLDVINKIIEIYEKYRVNFQIVIKDNCLRINSFFGGPNDYYKEYKLLYDLEMCNYELMKLFDELEENIKL